MCLSLSLSSSSRAFTRLTFPTAARLLRVNVTSSVYHPRESNERRKKRKERKRKAREMGACQNGIREKNAPSSQHGKEDERNQTEEEEEIEEEETTKVHQPWTTAEDLKLQQMQEKYGNKWATVAASLPGRTGQQCAQRWRHRVNPNIRREKWTKEEDEKVRTRATECDCFYFCISLSRFVIIRFVPSKRTRKKRPTDVREREREIRVNDLVLLLFCPFFFGSPPSSSFLKRQETRLGGHESMSDF